MTEAATGPASLDAALASFRAKPPPRWEQLVCGAWIAVGAVLAYVTIALTPSLLAHHVLILELMSGGASSIVTGGAMAKVGLEPLSLVALAPLPSIPFYAISYWWAGRLWGDLMVANYARGSVRKARRAVRAEAAVRRYGFWVLIVSPFVPVPSFIISVMCGASGMSLWLYLLGTTIGLLLWEGMLIGLGYAIGHPAVHAVKVIGHYSLYVTIGVVVVVIVASAMRQRRAAAVS